MKPERSHWYDGVFTRKTGVKFDHDKKAPFGFAGKSLVVNLFVQKTRAIRLRKPSQPGETPMSNNRFAKHIVDLRNFVLLKTYRKRATEDHILRVQIVKILVPYGCGPTRNQLRGRIVITENRRR